MAAVQSNWEALERFLRAEEVMGEENPVPLHALGAGRAQVSNALIQALDFLRKNDESQVVKQKILMSIGDMADEFGQPPPTTLDGNKLNATNIPSPASEATKPENNPYAELSATDRLFIRSYTEKTLAVEKLEAYEQQSKSDPTPTD